MSYLTVSEIYSQAETLVSQKTVLIIRAWVCVHRTGDAGKLQFVWLKDGSTMKEIQAVFHGELTKLDYLASVEIEGFLIKSVGHGQDWELDAKTITIVGDCPAETFPLPRKKLPMAVLRQYPHLRMRTNTMQAVFRIRHQLWMTLMEFFHQRGYISIHTPIITRSDCEGAGDAFRVDASKDFFPTQAYLTVSGQLEAEMAATALGKVFTCGPTFRAEHSNTPRHLSEFWMIEPEMVWHDLDDTITVAQELVSHCVADVSSKCKEELAVLQHSLKLPTFKRITYTKAVEIIREYKCKFETVPEWGDDLGTAQERFLTDEYFECPVVVTHYPREMKAFYMHQEPGGHTVACFDLLLPGIGEVIGGSQREIRLDVLEKEIERRGMDKTQYQRYLDLRRFGNVPHAGFGLGFERI
ncbi:hypothetical protein LCGC14_2185680, partial [marine sediment metagenome]